MMEAMRQRYKFSGAQLGFQIHTGAEFAIHRHIYNACNRGQISIVGRLNMGL